MLYNSQSPSTIGLIVPNKEAILRWLGHRHLDPQDPGAVDAALTLLEQEIDSYRTGGKHAKLFPERWLPSAVAVLEEPFSEQNRFLNSTMKMVRGRIAEAHQQRIQALFTGEGKRVHHTANRQAMTSLFRPAMK
jgi:long-chain acyl-CoA synthetase